VSQKLSSMDPNVCARALFTPSPSFQQTSPSFQHTPSSSRWSLPWASAASQPNRSSGRLTINRRASVLPLPPDADVGVDIERRESGLSRAMSRYTKLRYQMVFLLDDPFDKCSAKVLSTVFMSAIFIGVLIACLEQLFPDFALHPITCVICTVYTAEVSLRLWCSPHFCSFLSDWHNMVDTMNMLEIWCTVAISRDIWLKLVMIQNVRSLEVALRLAKLCRYSSSWQLLCATLVDAAPALLLPLGACLVLVALGAGLLLAVEEGATSVQSLDDGARALTSLFDAMVFCMICLTSHEPGPYYGLEVRTKLGHTIVGLLMVCGHVIFAMPIAIVGTCFCRTWFQRDRIVFADITRRRLKWQGKGASETLRRLFERFDPKGEGVLGLREFRRFVAAITPNPSAAKVLALFSLFDLDQDGAVAFEELHEAIYPNSDLEMLELQPAPDGANGDQEDKISEQAAATEYTSGPGDATRENPLSLVSRRLEDFERRVLETFEQRLRISRRQSLEQACKPFASRVSTPHAMRPRLTSSPVMGGAPGSVWTSTRTESFGSESEGSRDSSRASPRAECIDKKCVDKADVKPMALSTIPSTMAAAQRARSRLEEEALQAVSLGPDSYLDMVSTSDYDNSFKSTMNSQEAGRKVSQPAEGEQLCKSDSLPLSVSEDTEPDWDRSAHSEDLCRNSILSWDVTPSLHPLSDNSMVTTEQASLENPCLENDIYEEGQASTDSISEKPHDNEPVTRSNSAPVSVAQSSHDKWVAPGTSEEEEAACKSSTARRWHLFGSKAGRPSAGDSQAQRRRRRWGVFNSSRHDGPKGPGQGPT